MAQAILLVNTNITKPPVSPVGLEYVGESLIHDGVPVRVLDLSFEADWKAGLRRELEHAEFLAVGLSVRNTDDCSFSSRKSFLPWIRDVAEEVRRLSQAHIILGGVGFSVMPETVLKFTKADFGIAGDGEEMTVTLFRRLMNRENIFDLPGLVYWRGGSAVVNKKIYVDLGRLPLPRRGLFDNRKYENLGAMVGIETKRGCPQQCIFCADPVAKGNHSRLRPPTTVVQEFQDLLNQGVSWFHLSDSEFNLPITHAKEVCRAIIEAKLGDKLRWYTYCSPVPFDDELARLMRLAGCCGINFGVDSLCDEQLLRLGRTHSVPDIRRLVNILGKERLRYIFDLIVGGPGDTEDTVKTTIEEVKRLNIPLAGIAAGVRIYPETPLYKALASGFDEGGLYPEGRLDFDEPIFYLSPYLGSDVFGLIAKFVAGDSRFLVLSSPGEQASYNYVGAERLCQMIEEGARGAYWDILAGGREIRGGSH